MADGMVHVYEKLPSVNKACLCLIFGKSRTTFGGDDHIETQQNLRTGLRSA